MASADIKDKEFENNRVLINRLAQEDGKLVSPIDLNLDNTRHFNLDRLKWMNFGNIPVKMKLTNTGETVIITGKWSKNRPYLCGGPLIGNYVFSQVHFHWGSDEHEGSEHTVRGISYPMEVHVVFYKSQYLTQKAARKEDDGVMIVVYLVKLQESSTPAIRWLTNHLNKVLEPKSSTPLPLSPLSALIAPFNMDYLLYWGLLVTDRCSHAMLWLISRMAFSITVDDLNMFRKLINSRKEQMKRNFRGVSPTQGRTIVHINPSEEKKHVLLPGTIDPPDQTIIVNYPQMPPLDCKLAQQIFNKGDNSDYETKTEPQAFGFNSSTNAYTFCEGSQRDESDATDNIIKYKNSKKVSSEESCTCLAIGSNLKSVVAKHRRLKEDICHRTKSQKREYVLTRKNLERYRKLGHNIKDFVKNDHCDMSLYKVQKSYSNRSFKINRDHENEQIVSDLENNNNEQCVIEELKTEQANSCEHSQDKSIHENVHGELNENVQENHCLENKIVVDNLSGSRSNPQEITKEQTKGKSIIPSRLPTRRKGLQSSLAPYFSQSESNSQGYKSFKPEQPPSQGSPKIKNDCKKPVTTIPRPIGKNAGKIDDGGIQDRRSIPRYPQRRPASSPTKLILQKNQKNE